MAWVCRARKPRRLPMPLTFCTNGPNVLGRTRSYPNLFAVDFYATGDLIAVVNALNGVLSEENQPRLNRHRAAASIAWNYPLGRWFQDVGWPKVLIVGGIDISVRSASLRGQTKAFFWLMKSFHEESCWGRVFPRGHRIYCSFRICRRPCRAKLKGSGSVG